LQGVKSLLKSYDSRPDSILPLVREVSRPSVFLHAVFVIIRLLWRSDHHDQYRRGQKSDGEKNKGNKVASGSVKKKAEKRRSSGRENISEQQAHPPDRAERQPAEVVGPYDLAQHKTPSQPDAVEKKTSIDELDLPERNSQRQSRGLNQELAHRCFSDIDALREQAPEERGTKLGECDRAHKASRHDGRIADVGDEREHMEIQARDADAGDSEGSDEKPEGPGAEDFGSAPRHIRY